MSPRVRYIWIGLELPAPASIQSVTPNEIEAFEREADAKAWQRALRVTATSPTRIIVERKVRGAS